MNRDVAEVVDELAPHELLHICRALLQLRNALDGVGVEVEAVRGEENARMEAQNNEILKRLEVKG